MTRAGKKQIGLGARRRRRHFKGQFISMHCRRSTQSVRHTHTHTRGILCFLSFNLLTGEDVRTHTHTFCCCARRHENLIFFLSFFFLLHILRLIHYAHTLRCNARPSHDMRTRRYYVYTLHELVSYVLCPSTGSHAAPSINGPEEHGEYGVFFYFLNGLHYNTGSDNRNS